MQEKHMPKISIIVPVYNVEKYLPKCLDSILTQTFKDIEVICVNDGSTDGSLEILQEYAKKDSRIIIIDKENSGPGACRNLGIGKATGEYIQFVDSDDWIEKETCEICYQKVSEHNVDMLSFNANKVLLNEIEPIYYYDIKDERAISWKDIADKLFRFPFHSCHYLINKDFLLRNNIRYPENAFWCEDVPFVLSCWLKAEEVLVIPNRLYSYIQRENSITQNNSHFFDLFKLIPILKNEIITLNNNVLEKELSNWIIKHLSYINTNKNSLKKIQKISRDVDCEYEFRKFIQQLKTSRVIKLRLFGLIPFIKIKKKNNKISFYLLGVLILTIR